MSDSSLLSSHPFKANIAVELSKPAAKTNYLSSTHQLGHINRCAMREELVNDFGFDPRAVK